MFRWLSLHLLLLKLSGTSTNAEEASDSNTQVLNVDVAVVGGGAAGTYAAVRLREDLNTSVVLIEPKSHLGGSVSTYLVPETNTTLEFGVQTYLRYGPAEDFFTRFGIAVQPFTSRRLNPVMIDIETGEELKDYIAPSINATNEAFARWLALVSKYEAILEPGYWNFPQPKDIPSDLLTPFEEFSKIHQLDAAVPRIMTISGIGTGGIGTLLTFHIMQAFGPSITRNMLSSQFFIPSGSNSLIYSRALTLLGPSALLSSTILSVKRYPHTSTLLIQQGSKHTTIHAKRILYTAPPSLPNLAPFHLAPQEQEIFAQLPVGGEFIGVARIPCLKENSTYTYIPSSAVPDKHLKLKDYPFTLRFDSTGPAGLSLFRVLFSAEFTLSVERFKTIVAESLEKLNEAGSVQDKCTVEFKAVSDHTRPQWEMSREQMERGFVQRLIGMQGRGGMWWAGYVWGAPYSSVIWANVDVVLGGLVGGLKGSL